MDDDDMEKNVNLLMDTVWGPWRNNGLVGDVKAIRRMIEEQDRKARRREAEQRKEAEAQDEAKRKEKKADRKFWITTVLAIISAILIAAGIVASAL